MAYSDFTLTEVTKRFGLVREDSADLFSLVQDVPISTYLQETLEYNIPLATSISTEKARSELIITPVLVELLKRFKLQLSFFSGSEFTVDRNIGLSGVCDYIISKSATQLSITSPILIIVEAKNDNINNGFGQCVATMIAAKLFNEREKNDIPSIYGVVTTGSIWRFLKLTANLVQTDINEYYLRDLDKILGILMHTVEANTALTV